MNEGLPILIRIILTWICILFVFLIAWQTVLIKINKITLEKIEIPRNGIVVVDQNSNQTFSNGSPEHPFKTINDGLYYLSSNSDFSKLLIYPGKYEETLTLTRNVQLIGIGKNVEIVNPKASSGSTIKIHGDCHISNVNIFGGKFGIHFPLGITGNVVLNQVSVKQASQWGIFSERSPKLSLKILASEISDNARQGLYLKESTVYINNSKVYENGEEGIDLHTEMNSTIRDTEIFSNGEGGIETELGNIILAIEGCKIYDNGSSGINLQSFEENSTVSIKGNVISKNANFGIRCAIHAPFQSPYFSKALKILENNEIFENGDLEIDINCKR